MYADSSSSTSRIPCFLFSGIMLILEIFFTVVLVRSALVPTKLMIMLGVILLLLTVIVILLTWNYHYAVRMVIGCIIMLLISAIMVLGSVYLLKTQSTLEDITGQTIEITEMSVYVKADDSAQSIEDTKGYIYGTLAIDSQDDVNEALQEVAKAVSDNIQTRQYSDLASLIDALLENNEIQAIVMNAAFLDILSDMEGYEDAADQLRSVHTVEVENVIEHAATGDSAGGSNFTGGNTEGLVIGEDGQVDTSDMCFTMFISGIDSRSGLTAKSRSDVNIMMTVNTDTKQILLVSTPRDYFVPLSISNGVCDKLTHAGIYGIDVCIDTMEMLYDTDIDYYFRLNFTGFENIIDSLGGITVNSDYTFTSQNVKGYSFVAGENQVDGAAALAFARERYAFASGDRQRGKNQMAVIKGVAKKAMSPAILTSYTSVLSSLDGSFETSIPYEVISGLVRQQLEDGGEWNIVTYSVDGTGDSQKPYSLSTKAYVMVPDQSTVDHAIDLMNRVKAGEILTDED